MNDAATPTAGPQAVPRSVAAGYIRTLLDAVGDSMLRPVTADAVLSAAGLPRGLVDDPAARLPHDAVSAIWQAALRLTGDRHLGLHVGERVRPGSFDALGQLLMTCTSLGEAAQQAERFAPLVGGGGRFAMRSEADGGSRLLYLPFDPDWPLRRHRVEAVLAATLTFTRWLCGRSVIPQAVRFRHAAPEGIAEHRRIFGCPVLFDAGEDSLLLDAAALALPVRQASPGLRPVLAGYAEAELARLGDGDPFLDRVAAGIRSALAHDGDAGIEAVAASLSLAPRTLQRRLAERGTGFQAEVGRLRRALAQELLRDPGLSIATVAARLGFADPANFHRAFRTWTGKTPAQWRRGA